MKSKPVVMNHFSTAHSSFVVDFTFKNNITLLLGDSGTGKTVAFSFIRECMAINPKILCKAVDAIITWLSHVLPASKKSSSLGKVVKYGMITGRSRLVLQEITKKSTA